MCITKTYIKNGIAHACVCVCMYVCKCVNAQIKMTTKSQQIAPLKYEIDELNPGTFHFHFDNQTSENIPS